MSARVVYFGILCDKKTALVWKFLLPVLLLVQGTRASPGPGFWFVTGFSPVLGLCLCSSLSLGPGNSLVSRSYFSS